jgi:uncharacterized membrane protein
MQERQAAAERARAGDRAFLQVRQQQQQQMQQQLVACHGEQSLIYLPEFYICCVVLLVPHAIAQRSLAQQLACQLPPGLIIMDDCLYMVCSKCWRARRGTFPACWPRRKQDLSAHNP